MNERGRVVVRGRNILRQPLLDSTEANLIEIYDQDNRLIAFFVHIFTDNTWGLCTKDDPDWAEMCIRYGFSALKPGTQFNDLLTEGVGPFMHRSKP